MTFAMRLRLKCCRDVFHTKNYSRRLVDCLQGKVYSWISQTFGLSTIYFWKVVKKLIEIVNFSVFEF